MAALGGGAAKPLAFLRSVYDLDNLDTRMTTPSSVPYKTVVESRPVPDDPTTTPRRPDPRAKPSKRGTPEFYLYYAIFAVTVPYMFWIAYDVSRRRCRLACPCGR